MEKRAKREFTKEFKQQMVMLHASGKPASEIIREYDLTASAFHCVRQVKMLAKGPQKG